MRLLSVLLPHCGEMYVYACVCVSMQVCGTTYIWYNCCHTTQLLAAASETVKKQDEKQRIKV